MKFELDSKLYQRCHCGAIQHNDDEFFQNHGACEICIFIGRDVMPWEEPQGKELCEYCTMVQCPTCINK